MVAGGVIGMTAGACELGDDVRGGEELARAGQVGGRGARPHAGAITRLLRVAKLLLETGE